MFKSLPAATQIKIPPVPTGQTFEPSMTFALASALAARVWATVHPASRGRRRGVIIRDVVATAHVGAAGLSPAGISPAELLERGRRSIRRLDSVTPVELTRWLLEQGLAVEHEGLLQPTPRALELGTMLELG